jgi:serine/threonine protein kinase
VPVALKVINPITLDSTDALDRFLREARAAAKLRHPNIASVFRLGKVGETHFYAMEFCEGQTVHQLGRAARRAWS